MKTLYNKILLLFIFSLALWSCDKDEDRVVIQPGTKPTLTTSQSNLVLTEENAGNDAITFTWTAPDFGYSAAVTYSLEFGTKGSNFEGSIIRDYGNSMVKTLKVSEVNDIANQLKMEGFKAGEMEIRLRGNVGGNYAPTYSDVTSIMITPYLSEPPYATLYLVGGATEGGWAETAATPMFRDAADPFVFTYTGYLKADGFKILGVLGQWAPAWGMGTTTNGVTSLTSRPTTADGEVDPITLITTAGYYTITVDLRDNELTISPYDISNKAVYTKLGVLGEFNGWDATPNNDQMMTTTSVNPHIWSTIVTLPTKSEANAKSELKIRVNNSWDTNWGAEAGKQEVLYGKGVPGSNDNFKIMPGKYRLIFNDLTLNYVFIKQ